MRGRWIYIIFLIYGFIGLVVAMYGSSFTPRLRIGLIIAALVAGGLVYYFDMHRPAWKWKMVIISQQLPFIFKLIRSYIKDEFQTAELRCNIMLARRRFLFWGWRPLRIDFGSDGYNKAELEQSYKYNVGCCGTALAERRQVWFDSETAQEPYKGMTETQRIATHHVKSILSTLIFNPTDVDLKTPIAILNIDSEAQIRLSLLNNKNVQAATRKFAGLISWVLI